MQTQALKLQRPHVPLLGKLPGATKGEPWESHRKRFLPLPGGRKRTGYFSAWGLPHGSIPCLALLRLSCIGHPEGESAPPSKGILPRAQDSCQAPRRLLASSQVAAFAEERMPVQSVVTRVVGGHVVQRNQMLACNRESLTDT